MDCHVPVDDYCVASQAYNIEIPENIHSTDHFFIVFKLDTTYRKKDYPVQNQQQHQQEDVETDEEEEVEIDEEEIDEEEEKMDEEEEMDDEEEEDFEYGYVQVESSDAFWAPCRRLEHGNLSKETISEMLSKAGVPLHKQGIMVDTISEYCADNIANSANNKGIRVLPMLVSVSAIACWCYFEQVSAADQKKQTGDDDGH